jgi:hypothetical protein
MECRVAVDPIEVLCGFDARRLTPGQNLSGVFSVSFVDEETRGAR